METFEKTRKGLVSTELFKKPEKENTVNIIEVINRDTENSTKIGELIEMTNELLYKYKKELEKRETQLLEHIDSLCECENK